LCITKLKSDKIQSIRILSFVKCVSNSLQMKYHLLILFRYSSQSKDSKIHDKISESGRSQKIPQSKYILNTWCQWSLELSKFMNEAKIGNYLYIHGTVKFSWTQDILFEYGSKYSRQTLGLKIMVRQFWFIVYILILWFYPLKSLFMKLRFDFCSFCAMVLET
jgi:hypothetical protein